MLLTVENDAPAGTGAPTADRLQGLSTLERRLSALSGGRSRLRLDVQDGRFRASVAVPSGPAERDPNGSSS